MNRLKQLFCRHNKHERHIKASDYNHKVFCGGCGQLLQTLHREDSPIRIEFKKAGFDESFFPWEQTS